MRAPPRLPPVDTTGYVSCPIDTPLVEFDDKSPLPCIIVTPSSPTEYHIAFHHKDSPLKHVSFAAQQQQKRYQPRTRRAFLAAISPFVDTPPPIPQSFETPVRRYPLKARTRTALVLAVPIFIIACHLLATSLIRSIGLGNSLFGGRLSRGGFSTAAHFRAHREAAPQPIPVPDLSPIPAPDFVEEIAPPQPLAEPLLD